MKILKVLICVSILFIPLIVHANIYTIERVINGDTIKLSNGDKVHLIGVNAPENKSNRKAREESKRTGQSVEDIIKVGRKAADWVEKSFEGEKVFLRYDVKKKDRYGNKLAYVYLYEKKRLYEGRMVREAVEEVKDEWWQGSLEGKFIFMNATIISSGYAYPERTPPNTKRANFFMKLYRKTQENEEGLWDENWPKMACAKEGETIWSCFGCTRECCDDLKPMFDLTSSGRCTETPAPNSGGVCSNCGNNVCEEDNNEDSCNCFRDCD